MRPRKPAGPRCCSRSPTRPAAIGSSRSSSAADPVHDVGTEGMAFRQTRVLEIGGGIVPHAELLHDAAARQIAAVGEGDDLGQAEDAKAEVQPCLCAFGGEALAPQRLVELPADLDVAI